MSIIETCEGVSSTDASYVHGLTSYITRSLILQSRYVRDRINLLADMNRLIFLCLRILNIAWVDYKLFYSETNPAELNHITFDNSESVDSFLILVRLIFHNAPGAVRMIFKSVVKK